VHTHDVARACLGFQPGVRDFRRYVVQRLHHGSFFADEAWGRTCFATCPFHGVQAGWLRNISAFREALIWAQFNSDLEENANKDVR